MTSRDPGTQPVAVDPERIIERVYEHGGQPDIQSQDDFESYLVERMYGKDSDAAENFQPGTNGTITERRRDGWLLRPRTALIATIASSLALSLAGVKMPVIGNVTDKYVVDPVADVIDSFNPKYKKVENEEVTTPKSIKEYFKIGLPGREQRSGQAEDDTVTSRQLIERLEDIQDNPSQTVSGITLTGKASDEWLKKGDRSLGVSDIENTNLSRQRAAVVRKEILQAAQEQKVDMPEIEIGQQERVLGPEGLGELLSLVNKDKYLSIGEAIRAYNSGQEMNPDLRSTIKKYVGENRTVLATIDYEVVESYDNYQLAPQFEEVDEDHKLPLVFLPIPPIPRFRRSQRNVFDNRPILPAEPPEKAWIELYPEAMKMNGDLVDEAWSLTRKYQALLREERVESLASFSYRDEDDIRQNFNVAFVDHSPTQETLGAMSELLQVISKMNRGKVPERLNMIAVYPTSQTGPQHPKKIGLGIDEQYPTSTQGVAIPALSLAEIHMPTDPTPEDIERFNGMKWVMAHEIAGHFTDVKDGPVKLTKAPSYRRNRKDYHASDSWIDSTPGDFGVAGNWSGVPIESRQFSIPSQREEGSTEQTDEFITGANDIELEEAEFVRLSGIPPTAYGGKNARETQAETAAQATTEILIPFEETGLSSKGKKADGYAADAGLLFSFARRVGSKLNFDHLKWTELQTARIKASWAARHGIVQEDKNRRKISEKAKKTPYKPDDERLRVLADQED